MIPTGQDSLKTRSTLEAGGKTYAYYSLEKASQALGDISRLPFSMKVLLENLLRFEDGVTVTRDDLQCMVDWQKERQINREIQYRPARVLMQDFTGVPAVVDLAAMRDAMKSLGGDPQKINPLVPVHLVIDHSVMVDEFGTPKSFAKNVELEYAAQRRALRVPQMGQPGVRQFRGRAAGHRHLPPGQPRTYRPGGLDLARPEWRGGRLSRHAGRHRQPHDHGQRPRRARLGRRRHRGRGGDARPAGVDADPRSGRLPPDRRAQGRASPPPTWC